MRIEQPTELITEISGKDIYIRHKMNAPQGICKYTADMTKMEPALCAEVRLTEDRIGTHAWFQRGSVPMRSYPQQRSVGSRKMDFEGKKILVTSFIGSWSAKPGIWGRMCIYNSLSSVTPGNFVASKGEVDIYETGLIADEIIRRVYR